jgi:hypothetical protein
MISKHFNCIAVYYRAYNLDNAGKLYWKPKSTMDCSAREEEEDNGQGEKEQFYALKFFHLLKPITS